VRILITGATGFVGGHLIEHLRAEGGHELFGINRKAGRSSESPLPDTFFIGELTDPAFLESSLREANPEWVIHLAGYANAGASAAHADDCWRDNLAATRSLYDGVAKLGLSPRILFVSSGLIYGDPKRSDEPFTESAVLRPTNPYSASKAAADLLSYQVTQHPGLDVVRVRPFNHIGPRQSADYFSAGFAKQITEIERGRPPVITPKGDLSARRDLTDVRDMVAAYRLLFEKGVRGEAYNSGSGVTCRVGDVLDRLIELSNARVEVRPTPDPNRAGDVGVARADTAKLRAATGWAPRYSLDQTLKDVLAYWRAVAARSNH
jgi:GDP-4-dehydro-6-deoxy-D-mannose reductase